jgi:biopolymer transport protein TolQ
MEILVANIELDIIKILLSSGPVVKGVLLLLVVASIVSWAIIFLKKKMFADFKNSNEEFMEIYHSSKDLNEVEERIKALSFCPYSSVFEQGLKELNQMKKASSTGALKEHFQVFGLVSLERAIKKGINESNIKMEKLLSTLASIGSVSPFVGLFGTVWGIINSFTGLAGGGGTIEAVAPGIAEALVATAVGLAAAIPAVWFFNYFNNLNGKMNLEMENFEQEFLNVVERSII